ncbi:hypothetical protein BTS2_2621 [Bacillus sp. TS-2]|nr:hypothetical protein BTS2_2621 [Bacillus sp. TS-2]
MNSSTKTSQRVAIVLLVALILVFIFTQTSILSVLLASPWWIYLVIAGIIFSGYMSMKYMLEDHEVENEYIEKEGSVFIERMEAEREKRNVEKI